MKDKTNDFKLLGMQFTIVCDREIPKEDNPYYISPGGYELNNGKQFDFFSSTGVINSKDLTEVNFYVHELDDTYSSIITEDDLKLPFNEFFVFTGEDDESQIGIKKVKKLCFHIEKNGKYDSVPATKEQMESVNSYLSSILLSC